MLWIVFINKKIESIKPQLRENWNEKLGKSKKILRDKLHQQSTRHEKRTVGVEKQAEETDVSVKENVKSKTKQGK